MNPIAEEILMHYVVEEGTTNVQFKIENRTAFEGV